MRVVRVPEASLYLGLVFLQVHARDRDEEGKLLGTERAWRTVRSSQVHGMHAYLRYHCRPSIQYCGDHLSSSLADIPSSRRGLHRMDKRANRSIRDWGTEIQCEVRILLFVQKSGTHVPSPAGLKVGPFLFPCLDQLVPFGICHDDVCDLLSKGLAIGLRDES